MLFDQLSQRLNFENCSKAEIAQITRKMRGRLDNLERQFYGRPKPPVVKEADIEDLGEPVVFSEDPLAQALFEQRRGCAPPIGRILATAARVCMHAHCIHSSLPLIAGGSSCKGNARPQH